MSVVFHLVMVGRPSVILTRHHRLLAVNLILYHHAEHVAGFSSQRTTSSGRGPLLRSLLVARKVRRAFLAAGVALSCSGMLRQGRPLGAWAPAGAPARLPKAGRAIEEEFLQQHPTTCDQSLIVRPVVTRRSRLMNGNLIGWNDAWRWLGGQ